ncbi:MAG: type II secretion system protein GspG [Deltaproteobacteria bacterium]|nr:type II secretion system protein GspG [Deltaproteobacteria bacterium]
MPFRIVPNRRRGAQGFSLLELMVVITIVGLIASVTTVAVMNALVEARIKTTHETLRGCDDGLKLYALRHGRFPDTAQGLASLVAEKVLPKQPVDGWGREVLYTADKDGYALTSFGDDGAPGGEDAAADIVSRTSTK